jgi:hypothetical protein
MKRFLGAALVTVFVATLCRSAPADDQDAKAILDKAIKALGGEDRLAKAEAFTWKGKSAINFNGNENEFDGQVTIQGLDHYRNEFGNDQFKGVIVLSGDKGWRKFGDNGGEMEGEAAANEKRNVYLMVVPIRLVPLKGKGFKYETVGEEKVGGKPAVGLKVTGPDNKDFTIYFDKESGLPVKQVAKVVGFQGQEYTQETTFGDYKDFDGIKKATKVENKRDGEPFLTLTVSEFKVVDKVAPETFAEPK